MTYHAAFGHLVRADGELEAAATAAALAAGAPVARARGIGRVVAARETYGCSYGADVDREAEGVAAAMRPYAAGSSDLTSILAGDAAAARRAGASPAKT